MSPDNQTDQIQDMQKEIAIWLDEMEAGLSDCPENRLFIKELRLIHGLEKQDHTDKEN